MRSIFESVENLLRSIFESVENLLRSIFAAMADMAGLFFGIFASGSAILIFALFIHAIQSAPVNEGLEGRIICTQGGKTVIAEDVVKVWSPRTGPVWAFATADGREVRTTATCTLFLKDKGHEK